MNAPFPYSPRAMARQSVREAAFDDGQAWEDHPDAVAILARIDMLERLSDEWSGDPLLAAAAEDLGSSAHNLTYDELYHCRQRLLGEACREVEDESGTLFDHLDTTAPSVSDALKRARKNRLGNSVLPFGGGAPSLAAARMGPDL